MGYYCLVNASRQYIENFCPWCGSQISRLVGELPDFLVDILLTIDIAYLGKQPLIQPRHSRMVSPGEGCSLFLEDGGYSDVEGGYNPMLLIESIIPPASRAPPVSAEDQIDPSVADEPGRYS